MQTAVLTDRRADAPVRARATGGALEPRALARELARRVDGEVRFDDGSRALYATDASNYRQVPIGVVIPRSVEAVLATVAVCREFGVPILGRGAGTSLAGQCCNVAVVIDLSKYVNRVLEIDPGRRLARVQPGVVLDELREAAQRHGLTFGPDPATHSRCTLGGMIGNNSCGVHSVMAAFAGTGARTSDNIEALEVLTYDGVRMRVGRIPDDAVERLAAAPGREGEIVRRLLALRERHAESLRTAFPRIPRRVSGYNLPDLLPENGFNLARALVGSESTCVIVLEATVQLIPWRKARSLLVLGYPDVATAADDVPALLETKPVGLEGMDDRLIGDMREIGLHPGSIDLLPAGAGWLMAEYDGDGVEEAQQRADAVMDRLRRRERPPSMRRFDGEEAERIWEVRESGLAATAHVGQQNATWPGWEDSAVPPERLGGYLRDLRRLFDEFGYGCALYGHFGQGCVHTRIDFDLVTADGIGRFRQFVERAADLVARYGGSFSGEHGDGQARGELLGRMYPPDVIAAFREFKAIWDPDGRMNPGKVIDANPLDGQLRLGAAFHGMQQAEVETHFSYPGDGGKFSNVAIRCVGVGLCRRHDGGTMCPSYMATREEKHTTRGRARLLFEMLRGETITDGWRSEAVREALDLCLACKGCKGDCPVHVDMASYKAEFLAHHYEGRLRPREAYAFGRIHKWSRLAARMPGLVNLLARSPLTGGLARAVSGMAAQRSVPAYAGQTFVAWFRQRRTQPRAGASRVLVWPDTFNNYFHPHVLIAAVEVLEAAGYDVAIPDRLACCSRPLYDFGMLDEARDQLRDALRTLKPALDEGVPVVGLEPSCISTFRDEATNFFPDDPLARAAHDNAFLFSEFLLERPGSLRWPDLGGRALVHEHCHHKSFLAPGSDVELMRRLGLEVQAPDSGCCGLAGPFGYKARHYDVSMQIGERVLLPAVRGAGAAALVVSDGFACREQIAHGSGRRALHPAEVLRLALRERVPASGEARERAAPAVAPARLPSVAVVAGAALAAGLAWWWTRRR